MDVIHIRSDPPNDVHTFSHVTSVVMKIDKGPIYYINDRCRLSLAGVLRGVREDNSNIMACM
ncbi:hypothetical protein KSF78_0005587 [Schistosoma japonicum]|nr:hypothetical protein KSF78_0005587 [Schistosoma japonicum]